MDIASFIARDNPTRALTFVDELQGKCEALGMAPGIGTARPELGEGISMLP
jgi:toxin ParE1/3/4